MREITPIMVNPAQQAIDSVGNKIIHLLHNLPADEPVMTANADLHGAYVALLYPINGEPLANLLTHAVEQQQHATEEENLDFQEAWYGIVEAGATLVNDWFHHLYPQPIHYPNPGTIMMINKLYRSVLKESKPVEPVFTVAEYITLGLQHIPMETHPKDETFEKFAKWLDNYFHSLKNLAYPNLNS